MLSKPAISVVRGILKNNNNQYLFLQRSCTSKSWPGLWEFPGGKVNPAEDLQLALAREFYEETNLKVEILPSERKFYWERATDRIIYRVFRVNLISGELRISQEHDAWAWFGKEDYRRFNVSPPLINIVKETLCV